MREIRTMCAQTRAAKRLHSRCASANTLAGKHDSGSGSLTKNQEALYGPSLCADAEFGRWRAAQPAKLPSTAVPVSRLSAVCRPTSTESTFHSWARHLTLPHATTQECATFNADAECQPLVLTDAQVSSSWT
jgi:hypothetical protein